MVKFVPDKLLLTVVEPLVNPEYEVLGAETANAVRVLYGGSVKPNNARELFSQPNIDGGLVGGASLDAHELAEIVRAAL